MSASAEAAHEAMLADALKLNAELAQQHDEDSRLIASLREAVRQLTQPAGESVRLDSPAACDGLVAKRLADVRDAGQTRHRS